ncbi:hypothetical protein COCON_G00081890 [Conger conger]|uniref:Uncharacterized protein n=1 Tax=Conger conger TaxID=82655 RepID=A0A9Q1DPQ9_CONCO|nr:hypothetical protein COCON_G00081890 [Conger conger]
MKGQKLLYIGVGGEQTHHDFWLANIQDACIIGLDLFAQINQAQEDARVGEYPFHCLDQLVDPEYQERTSLNTQGLASCDLWINELRKSAHKQLLSDIRNALYMQLTASNITLSRSKKPVIHMGAEQEPRQFPNWLKNDGENNIRRTMDNLRWNNINGLAVQHGMMGYSPDGEIVVHQEGLYFVYSQENHSAKHPQPPFLVRKRASPWEQEPKWRPSPRPASDLQSAACAPLVGREIVLEGPCRTVTGGPDASHWLTRSSEVRLLSETGGLWPRSGE